MTPQRIQLRRAKGWRMPPNTIKVDRTTKWGNPFIIGKHGTREECVYLFTLLMAGNICLTTGDAEEQVRCYRYVSKHRETLRGKNLGCWCKPGTPCHADVLLEIANKQVRE